MPSTKSLIPTTVNVDLQKERDAADLNVEEFAAWYYGGADKLKFKRDVEKFLYKDTESDNTLFHYKSHDEIFNYGVETSIDMLKRLIKCQAELNPGGNDIFPGLVEEPVTWGATPAGNPFGVPMGMALSAVRNEGTDEQFEKFGKRMERLEISATYAQTEMGHGTFVRGLETRADFDAKTDEFVLNSPTLTAYKWWPGGLGHASNYCVLVARLYIDNEAKGVQMFMVPLRDPETHMPLPGIDIGDIGKKVGFYGVNNGYLGLKNVRIPRTNMLMRNAQVLRDGTFIKSPVSVLTYFTMVHIRCLVVRNFACCLAMGATIATRYSAVRRQSPINPNEPEPQIIDHVTQQLKLFPEIANAIAYHLSSRYVIDVYEQTKAEIARGEFQRLPEMHALTCAMKALCTTDAAAGIERMRLGCGGHGYLISSNMGPLFAAAQAASTYEGENTVLLLQVGRFLLKSWRSVVTGKATLTPTVAYLTEVHNKREFGQWTGSWQNMVQALQFVAANKTRLAFESMAERLKAGQTEAEAANNTGIELIQAAELHGRCFIASTFLAQVTNSTNVSQRSANLNKILEQLLELYLVNTTLQCMKYILLFIRLDDNALRSLQNRLEFALAILRPNAVAICDGFDFHDNALSSTLGSYDGNVYERLFQAAKQSPLNQQPVPKSFHEVLKPFMKSNM